MSDVQITFRDIPFSPAVETHIRKRAQKLDQFYDRVIRCRVVIELPQKHKHRGKMHNIRIDTLIPGKELVCTHKCNEDIYVSIRDAFKAMERQLEEQARKRHGRTKTHQAILHGNITRLNPDEAYGFIAGQDGSEYYFSVTNVHYPRFAQLHIGDAVQYTLEPSEGKQAHHVVKEKEHA